MTAALARNETTRNDELDGLRNDYPGFAVWQSSGGRWWGTRKGTIPLTRDRHPGWAMTIDADTSAELRAALDYQKKLR
jgi:hypothetical protein